MNKTLIALLVLVASGCSSTKQLSNGDENKVGGHEYVDLGLPSGRLWATCNVGATKETDSGDFFAWGETKPKEDYNWKNYKWSKGDKMTKYGSVDGKKVLDSADDVATVKWGKGWRMPSYEEMEELRKGCSWKWMNNYNGSGVSGGLGTSKVNGSTIFLPAAGFPDELGFILSGTNGGFWSSSKINDGSNLDIALSMHFDEDGFGWSCSNPSEGYNVRAVVNGK